MTDKSREFGLDRADGKPARQERCKVNQIPHLLETAGRILPPWSYASSAIRLDSALAILSASAGMLVFATLHLHLHHYRMARMFGPHRS